jgi:hypothetical protein
MNVHVWVALRRRKDNPGMTELCHRIVCRDGTFEGRAEGLTIVKELLVRKDGKWRIYRSAAPRDTVKAQKALMIEIIKEPTRHLNSISSRWKSLLMKPQQASARVWLLDIDNISPVTKDRVIEYVKERGSHLITTPRQSPNGWHIVVQPFDNRAFSQLFPDVEIKKDALLFWETVDNTKNARVYCMGCGEMTENANFCGNCGADLAEMEGERDDFEEDPTQKE